MARLSQKYLIKYGDGKTPEKVPPIVEQVKRLKYFTYLTAGEVRAIEKLFPHLIVKRDRPTAK